jgi:hypothetical protein
VGQARGRQATAGRCPTPTVGPLISDRWSPTSGRPAVGDWSATTDQLSTVGCPLVGDQKSLTSSCPPALRGSHFFLPASPFFFLPPFFSSFFPHFWALWSTPPHWLQHMPALPIVHLKTSNTHNF